MDYHKEEGIWSKYSRSKAGNVIQAAEYARRMKESGIISLSLNPGNFVTNLQQNMPKMQALLLSCPGTTIKILRAAENGGT
ncbi:hypothetical protein COL940_009539 [Colletotrichum noveboracense]|nr:hypothetical protein COL940_009539 [Colletotrichum noveboracense]